MERFILSVLTGNLKNNQGIRPSQHGFMQGESCWTNLIFFYDQLNRVVDEGKAVDVIYLAFRKAFDTVPTASSCRNWLPMVWMSVLFSG